MLVDDKSYRTVWMEGEKVLMIDQNLLPFRFHVVEFNGYQEVCRAIKDMTIRGAGAIGAAAGFAMAQAFLMAPGHKRAGFILQAKHDIEATRPTARNLFYAVEKVYQAGMTSVEAARACAQGIADDDARDSESIGRYGNELIGENYGIATHCNAGWLAFVDYGTALSPIYRAAMEGKKPFVYVDETRPRGQGARLTAWELGKAGIEHAIIADNATASFMASGKIKLMIVGADRIAANGDVANKIGTLEKAIAAAYYGVPFYVAAPRSTIDRDCRQGKDITIEYRSGDELLYQDGITGSGERVEVMVCSPGANALNPAFDVTPAALISGIITEKGIVKASADGIRSLFN